MRVIVRRGRARIRPANGFVRVDRATRGAIRLYGAPTSTAYGDSVAIPTHYEELSAYLGQHVKAEEGALRAYEAALEDRPDDVISYLVRMILEDEARHHTIFRDFQNTLESRMQLRSIGPVVPSPRVKGDVTQLLQTTEQLLRLEQEDAKELKALRRQWAREPGERRLWALLVETAEYDTKKHIRMLKYLRGLLRDTIAEQAASDPGSALIQRWRQRLGS